MKPMFSVIVPIYKVESYLEKCIESILHQTYTNFELLLVDDGSPDNCPIICDQYAKKDNRIHVIHKTNGGLVSARNIGIQQAKGQYICYVDGDDWILPNLLEEASKVVNKYNNVDMILYQLEKLYKNRIEVIECKVEEGFYDKTALETSIYPYMIYDSRQSFCHGLVFPAACNKIYKKELLEKHYCHDEQIKMGEDNAFVYECLLYSNSVYFLNQVFYEYNQLNDTSFQNRYDPNRFKNNQLLIQYMENRIGDYSETIEKQMNAFKAYWLIMAIFHEVKQKNNIFTSRKHIKQEIKKNHSLDNIELNTLPRSAKYYLILLKMHLYTLALIAAYIINKKRSKS